MTYRIAKTPGFKRLWQDSLERNRSPVRKLIDQLDPDGVHVVERQFVHNDVEIRAIWMVKKIGEDEPSRIFMDNSFEAFGKWTVVREDPSEAATG